VKLLANVVQREALVLTYNDVLMLLGVAFVAGLCMMPLVSRPRSMMAH
jgi:DHA2 family multidrug resistance protein